jgi:hypothetical protein
MQYLNVDFYSIVDSLLFIPLCIKLAIYAIIIFINDERFALQKLIT